MSPVDVLSKYHPILSKFSIGFNYELLLNKVRVLTAFQHLYHEGGKCHHVWVILYGRVRLETSETSHAQSQYVEDG